ncbi:MAG: hypothetical protein K0S28_2061, partial [Paucimonas sp.]|nr:hypothetical protein [Paucimonas sp.]
DQQRSCRQRKTLDSGLSVRHDSDSHTYPNTDSYPHTDTDSDTDSYADTDSHTDTDSSEQLPAVGAG